MNLNLDLKEALQKTANNMIEDKRKEVLNKLI